jgi:SIR2-like domain
MIGAGFSRNAQPSTSGIPPFPLLEDYRTLLAQGLNLTAIEAARLPLERLGDEYEASFGREALNDSIIRLIPWRQYKPGLLHRLLLNLPWADVFTTNYDTLLEDTAVDVPDRKYDLVVLPDDIPTATAPRIVKLHGSFPSTRPFIFTEEDFRGYPRRFAPFVNLVQQGMMEHTLCLLGFSGDDPNFLRWAGWVRDELGVHRPRIYLVGVLNLADGRRRYLEQLGISPVDLAELFPWRAGEESDRRHRDANEWFLRSLANGSPLDRRRWPDTSPQVEEHTLPVQPLRPRHQHVIPEIGNEGYDRLDASYRHARAQRLAYPGWEICPPEKREHLHIGAGGWFGRGFFDAAVEQPAPLGLLIAREGVWQLTLQGEPLTPLGVEALDTLLEGTPPNVWTADNPPKVVLPATFSLTGKEESVPWVEVKTAWVELAFAQLSEAREDVHEERFQRWEGALKDVVRDYPDWEARLHWEGVRWAITRLDRENALERLSRWPVLSGDLFWEARRAAALGEIGELEAAHTHNREALLRVRAAQIPGQPNYKLLSQEAWLIMQDRFLSIGRHLWDTEQVANQRRMGRLDALRQYDCDPWGDTARLKFQVTLALGNLDNVFTGSEASRTLDNSGSGPAADRSSPMNINAGPALTLLRLCEWGGCPLRVGHSTFGAKELSYTLIAVSHAAFRLGVLTWVRTGEVPGLNAILSRDVVAAMREEDMTFLYDTMLAALNQRAAEAERARDRIRYPEHQFTYRVFQNAMQVLSRLMLRADAAQREAVLDLALRLGDVHAVQQDHVFYEPLGDLLRQTVQGMTERQQRDALPKLAAFPIPREAIVLGDRWPNPLQYKDFTPLSDPLPLGDVQRLLADAGSPKGLVRRLALARLGGLFHIKALGPEAIRLFAQVLWEVRDAQGLPAGTPFLLSAFLNLPAPDDVNAGLLLKTAYLNGLMFESSDVQPGESPFGTDDSLELGYRSLLSLRTDKLEWATDDVEILLHRLRAWWPGVYRTVASYVQDFGGNGEPIEQLLAVLTDVLLPVAGPHAEAVRTFISEVEQNKRDMGLTSSGEAPRNDGARPREALNALISSLPQDVREGSREVERLLEAVSREKLDSDPELRSLEEGLLARVIYRASPALGAPLATLAQLVVHGMTLREEARRQVTLSLEYLAQETGVDPSVEPVDSTQNERHEQRAAASALAAALYQQSQSDPDPILLIWRDIGRTDSSSEVRRPWIQPETEE